MTTGASSLNSVCAALPDAKNQPRFLANFALVFILLTSMGLANCAGTGSAPSNPKPPSVAVTINPTSASLQPNGKQQFSADVTGTSNTSVMWSASA
jgi:hypothetical protein